MSGCRAACICVLVLLAWQTPQAPGAEGLVINEFLAGNNTAYVDEDGTQSDWLEIYNDSTSTADLTDLYLTDSAANLTQWRFPSVTLGAGQYLVVFASSKNRRIPGQPLHTNFKLGGGGEFLALVDGDGFTVIHGYAPAFPPQLSNVSYGISTEETGELRYFSTPTPGSANSGDYLGIVADTKFSVDRGFYSAPLELTITSATGGSAVRYTLDHSTPTEVYGSVYTGPILIDKTTVVRALAYKTGYRSTDVDTQTYIFPDDVRVQPANPPGFPSVWGGVGADYQMDPRIVDAPAYSNLIAGALLSLPTLSIATHKDNLFSGSIGIYANPGGTGQYWERPVSMEWIDAARDTDFQINAGMRVFGGYFRDLGVTRKKSLRLSFKAMYGPSKLENDIFPDQANAESYNTIVLRAGANDGYNNWGNVYVQYIIDEFVRRSQLAMGQPSALGTFAHLYLDGLYWGLYNPAERPDAAFAASYFGGDRDNWDSRSQDELGDGTWDLWNAMINQCRTGLTTEETFQKLIGNNPDGTRNPAYQVLLDVPNYIDYILLNFWIGNADWPGNNWRAAGDRSPAGTGYKFMCWDAELSMLSPWTGLGSNMTGAGGGAAEPFQYLRQNAEFQLQFADHVQRHMFNGGPLTADAVVARYTALADLIESAIIGETARWGDQYGGYPRTLETWRAARNNMLANYLPLRPAVFLQQLRNAGLYPALDAPTFNQHGGAVSNGFELVMSAADPISYTLDSRDPRERLTGNIAGSTYTLPLPLPYSVVVKARARSGGGVWSALTEALFVVPAEAPLQITELMYNPRDPQGVETNAGYEAGEYEFIELHNATSNRIGLAGVRFTDGIAFDFTSGSVATLDTNEYVLVVKNLQAFTNRYPQWGSLNIAGEYTGSLGNGGEQVRLKDGLDNVVLSFTYKDSRGWPLSADGAGHALVPLLFSGQNDGVLDYGGNWRAGTYRDGSPGVADPILPAGLRINEVVAHTDYTNALHPGYDSNDAIELYHAGTGTVSLAQWYLSDNSRDLKKWAVPATNVIAAGGWKVFDEITGFHSPITNGFGLNKAGDEVYLSFLPGTAEDRVVDGVSFKGQENGRSLGRYPDGGPWWYALAPTTNTPGTANAAPVFDVVISEIMYHPRPTPDNPEDNTHDEYVEIHNVSGSPVPLWTAAGAWRIDGGVGYVFPDNFTLPADGYAVLVPFDPTNVTARTLFLNVYGLTNTEVQLLGPYDGKLSNRGDRIALERPQEPDVVGDKVSWVIMDEVIYFDRTPWPAGTDGTGQSLQRRVIHHAGNDPSNWEAGFWSSPGFVPPVFRISVPNYAETVLLGSSVPVATDFDSAVITGTVSGVEFFVDGAGIGVDATDPYEGVMGPLTEERTYTLTATLTDNTGSHPARPVAVSVATVNNGSGATGLGITGARLNGALSNNGSADVSIHWGDVDGDTNGWSNVIDLGRQTDTFSAPIIGLMANGQYYYRCRATNAYGALWAAATTSFVTEPPQVSLSIEGSPFFENAGTATVHAHLSRLSAADVTVGLAFSGAAVYGDDYVASSTSIVIAAGQETSSITLIGQDDLEVESTESVIVSVGSLILGATGTPALVTATLISDDPRVVNTAAANVTDSTALAGGNLTHGYGSSVTVYWGTTDGGTNKTAWDAESRVGTRPEGPFIAAIAGLHANQTYFYRCYALNAGGEDWADDSQTFHTGPPAASIDDTSVVEGNAGTVDALFAVQLSAKSALNVSVDYATADGTAVAGADYDATQGTLIIPAGQAGSQIAVPVRGDALDEWPSESFAVNLTGPTNCTLADAQGTGLVRDDDVAVTLASWLFKMKIAFPGYQRDEALHNFPALVNFDTNLVNFAYSQLQSSSDDGQQDPWSSLRFANADLTALLNYEVEQWNTNGRSHVWVQVPELSGSNAFIWAYWGEPGATSTPAFTTNGATWSAGYKGVWHMASPNARDATALGHHGTAVGSVNPVPDGVIAGANAFDADIDYITVPDSDDFTLSDDYTISAWINSDDIGNQDEGFFGSYNGQGFMLSLQNDPGNTLRFWSWDWRSSDTAVTNGQWTHVAYTRKGAVGRFYVNGDLVRSRTDALAGGNGGELHLGAAGTSWGGNRFDGQLDEVRMATEERSSNWVWACWLNQASNGYFSSYGEVEAADTNVPSLFIVYGATNITDSSACPTARLTSTGTAETVVWAYWGPDDGGQLPGDWAHTNAFGPVSEKPYIDYSFCATGLQANTLYHYAYRAANSHGETWASAEFSAAGQPLVGNTGGSTNTGIIGSVTLRGRLLNASPAHVTVYWGPSDGGTDKLAWAASAAVGSLGGNASFSTEADNLLYGVTYYYRCYATNSYGQDWADAATSFLSAEPEACALTVRDGLVLWLDAEDVDGDGTTLNNPADGEAVTAWRDRSGFGHHADNSEGNAPIYREAGLNDIPVLRFEGSSYLYTTYDFDALTRYSIFSVARYTGGDSERVISSRTHNWLFGFWANTDERWYAEGWIYGAGTANTEWHLHAGTINSNPDPVAGFWKDGQQLTLDSRGSHDTVYKPGRLGLGGGNGANSEASRCEIAEVLIFDRVLAGNELDAVGSYLAQRYDLTTEYSGDFGGEGVGVNNGEAVNVTSYAAQLTGTLNASGSVFNVWLHWGDNDAGPGGAWDQSVFFGSFTNAPSVPLSLNVSGLTADTSYYYTFSAENAAGVKWSEPSAEFVTLLNPNDFTYRTKLSFTNYAGSAPLTNFPALVRFGPTNGFYDGFASLSGWDLRFTSADGTRLNHEFDGPWDRTGESTVWVQVPRLTATDFIWAYWGNKLVTTQPAFTTNGAAWSDGFASVWHMNETAARDSSGRGHHGAAQGAVANVPGMIRQGDEFDPGEYIRVDPSTDYWLQTGDFTMSAWIYPRSTSGSHGIFGNWDQRFIFAVEGNLMRFHANNQVFWPGSIAVSPNNWYLATVTRRGADWSYYLNGVQGDSRSNAGWSIDGWSKQLNIGAGGENWRGWWDGVIDEPRIESKGRSADWVAACYSNQVAGSMFVTLGPDIVLVHGIANQPASNVLADSATLNARLYSKGTSYYATVYWGPSDGGTNASAWDHESALGTLFADTGMTNISYPAATGITGMGTNYFTWRVTNGAYSAWARPSAWWGTEREWRGTIDTAWNTAGNWVGDNVPDAAEESVLFAGTGPGEVNLGGNSYANSRITFTAGNYTLTDTNASPGALTQGSLLNAGGVNRIGVAMTVNGTAEVAGGTLTLARPDRFSATELKLSGGMLGVEGAPGVADGPMTWDFESGDLTGWNDVGTVHGPDNLFSVAGNEPVSHTRYGGKHGTYWIDCYDTELWGGGDGYTGILESDPFLLGANCQFALLVGGGGFAWSGDPDAPVANLAGVALERQVATGDWENLFWETGGGNSLSERNWNASAYENEIVRLRIYDTHTGGWGHTQTDYIRATAIKTVGPIDMTSIPVDVVASSSIRAASGTNAAAMGYLTVSNNVTLTTAAGSPVEFQSTMIPEGVTGVVFNTSVDTYLGGLTGPSDSE